MKKENNIFWETLIIFEILLLIKIILSFFHFGPLIIPDEICVIEIAKHFAHNFAITPCSEITSLPAGNPFPLYSIIISPIFYFFKGYKSFQVIQIVNSILSSLIVFPLYGIIKQFIKRKGYIRLIIFAITLSPQITTFAQTAMTETLFSTLVIWLLYNYISSFTKQKTRRNTAITIILCFLSTITRPFGFIVPLAIIINEIILIKKRKAKKLLLLLTIFTISLFGLFTLAPQISDSITEKLLALRSIHGISLFFTSFIQQGNSLIIATISIPLIIFITNIFSSQNTIINKIRWFLVALISLNFIISAQHIFGYHYFANIDPGMITRYINISIILILLFSLIFIFTERINTITNKNIIVYVVTFILIAFIQDSNSKLNLNLDQSFLFNGEAKALINDLVESKNILKYTLVPVSILLTIMVLTGKRLLLSGTITFILILESVLSIVQLSIQTEELPIIKFFEEENANIVYLAQINEKRIKDNQYGVVWLLTGLTNNKIELSLIHQEDAILNGTNVLRKEYLEKSKFIKESKYIITQYFDLDLPLIGTTKYLKIYENTQKAI